MTSPSPKVSNKSYEQPALNPDYLAVYLDLCLQRQASHHTCSVKMYTKGGRVPPRFYSQNMASYAQTCHFERTADPPTF